jgi:hypothetical protein
LSRRRVGERVESATDQGPQLLVTGSQELSGAHSVPSVQVKKHVFIVASQVKFPQSITVPGVQFPPPSQKRSDVTSVMLEHVCDAHWVKPSYISQAPKPSQSPFARQVDGSWRTHMPVGSGASLSTSVHVPSDPGSPQLWHCEHAFVPQQTPSTQNVPTAHWSLPVHDTPVVFCATHADPLQ